MGGCVGGDGSPPLELCIHLLALSVSVSTYVQKEVVQCSISQLSQKLYNVALLDILSL